MRKMPRLRVLLGSLLLVTALLALAVAPAMAQTYFSPFRGNVTIGGVDAPVGTVVEAYIDGVPRASVETTAEGRYSLAIAGGVADIDKVVSFKVNGVDAVATPAPTFQLAAQDVDLALEPAECEWSNLSVTPTEGVAPLEITASADVTNAGGVAGDCPADLKVDGTVVDSQTVSVAGGATETATFTYELSDAGTYEVTIDDLTAVSVEVTLLSVEDGLASIMDYLVVVYGYKAGEGVGGWTLFKPEYVDTHPEWNTLTTLYGGRGYWINVTSACTLTYGTQSYDLDEGWNLIGGLGA